MASRDPGTPARPNRLLRAAGNLAPIGAVLVFLLAAGAIVAASGDTLGYDYSAYVQAARRVLDGLPLYDPGAEFAVGFALFLYPPPFAVLLIPFALLPESPAMWIWLAGLVALILAAIALMPVRRSVRVGVLFLGAVSWPVLYSIKLGQVGPLLLLAFVCGWRWIKRPDVVGVAMAVGTLIKVQPGLFFGWALVTRRWRTFGIGVAVLAVVAAGTAIVVGPGAFVDYLTLLVRISKPVTTPHNFTAGAVAFQAGLGESAAALVQWLTIGFTLLICAWGWIRADVVSSYVATVAGSQLISPVLWDHYAMLLLIPTALLLERRQWWAIAIPLVGWGPPIVFPVAFVVCLIAPLLTGLRGGGSEVGTVPAV